MVQYEYDIRRTLAAYDCTSAPLLHKYKHGKQTENGLFPDCWIIYMLIQQAPGITLGYIDVDQELSIGRCPLQSGWILGKHSGLPGSMFAPFLFKSISHSFIYK